MKIKIDPKNECLTDNKEKLDKREALKAIGVKAAVCFRDGEVTPEQIRDLESDDTLIKRALKTIISDHTSPSEQVSISLEITEIPKIMCMILNNEHQYSADERSLRYTLVKKSDYISDREVELYNKWLDIFIDILNREYLDFFKKFNQGSNEEETTKKTNIAIKKIAQENARYMISVFMPTTITYTVPLAQINKICMYMQKVIDNPETEFENLLVPYMNDFIAHLKDLDVLITEHDAHTMCPSLNIPDTGELLYKNNKNISLSLFADYNNFSGINQANQYGVCVSYNMDATFASLAQFNRHRTMNFEMKIPSLDDPHFYVPKLLNNNPELQNEWLGDIASVSNVYPQGMLVKTNMNGPLKHLVNYVGKERACDRAFLETEDLFTNQMLPDIYEGLVKSGNQELAMTLKRYTGKLRCMYPDYKCPAPCGHPRIKRDF